MKLNTITKVQNESESLVHYYEAMELLLTNARNLGEYRTHFGCMDTTDVNYCFFKAIAKPQLYCKMYNNLIFSTNNLHELIFKKIPTPPNTILDVGCGSGGTMLKLSEKWKRSHITGININAVQIDKAKTLLKEKNTNLILDDFLKHQFDKKFDLIYFIESAFHIHNKVHLCEQLSKIIEINGEIIIVDIFYSDHIYNKVQGLAEKKQLFNYLSVNKWCELFDNHGIQFKEFVNISDKVANHITVNTKEDEFVNNIVPMSNLDVYYKRHLLIKLLEAFNGYKKLSKQLRGKHLNYGILKFRKHQ
jgi:ubiquinone/menaquinone biosynthesis C-methylase UbiE